MKLYELSNQYQKLIDMDTSTPEDFEAFNELMGSLIDTIELKADAVAAVIRTLNAEADSFAEEIKRLQERKKSIENKSQSLKAYLMRNLQEVGLDKVQGRLFSVAIQKNPPSLIVDESKLDDEYFKVVKQADNSRIKDLLKAGVKIQGAELVSGESLRIK